MIKTIVIWVLAGGLIAACWFLSHQAKIMGQERAELTHDRKGLENERAHLGDELAARNAELLALRESLKTPTQPNASIPFENALEEWLGKVVKLNDYLKRHPEKRIPQLDLVTASDWLDVTKAGELKTEADYRRALAHLRGLARQKLAPVLSDAIKSAIAQNGGQIPTDAAYITSFLPAEYQATLGPQLVLNPSGKIAGLKGDLRFVVLDAPVDPYWDATGFYSDKGGYGAHSDSSKEASSVAQAYKHYAQQHGSAPTAASDLRSDPEVKNVSDTALTAIFSAMTSPVK